MYIPFILQRSMYVLSLEKKKFKEKYLSHDMPKVAHTLIHMHCTHTKAYSYSYTCILIHMHAHTHAYSYTCMLIHMHTHTHALHIHTCILRHMHRHNQAHIHTWICIEKRHLVKKNVYIYYIYINELFKIHGWFLKSINTNEQPVCSLSICR